eukprot:TRINITY_DN10356_c0_g1_i1.p1 TRINITY_DN10356_c0_g1~~TRINITY_DN10356_c0_g1_i1.p1  ORF type:complete len:291 (+),score=51.66 TRINITY_DN10356_c0_g1_i1:70-942(+)
MLGACLRRNRRVIRRPGVTVTNMTQMRFRHAFNPRTEPWPYFQRPDCVTEVDQHYRTLVLDGRNQDACDYYLANIDKQSNFLTKCNVMRYLSKLDKLKECEYIFLQFTRKDVWAYNTIIEIYSDHADEQKAKQYFNKLLEEEKVYPNCRSFTLLMQAFMNVRDYYTAYEYFLQIPDYKIKRNSTSLLLAIECMKKLGKPTLEILQLILSTRYNDRIVVTWALVDAVKNYLVADLPENDARFYAVRDTYLNKWNKKVDQQKLDKNGIEKFWGSMVHTRKAFDTERIVVGQE